jgi:uroporphyrinogen decarboxylase
MTKKKATMTDRERIEAILRREKPDRVPNWTMGLGFCTLYIGGTIADAYNNPEMCLAGQRKACQDFDWVFFPFMITSLNPAFGGEIKWPSGEYAQAPTVHKYPVETPEDVMNLKMPPDIKTAGTAPMRMEFCKLSSQERLDNEPFNVMVFMGGAFTNAAGMPGIENFGRWMLRKPEVVHHLMRIVIDYYVELAQYWKDTFGIEGVLPFFGEPTTANQIISPKQFEQFAMPYLKELCEALLAMGYRHIYPHICGEQNLNLPYWAQIPFGDPGIISVGHEVELETAAKYFPNDIIMGNLEPAIIQTRTPQEVYQATREVVEKGKKISTGYIFAPGCELPPKAPIENLRAMSQAIDDFGWYE